MASVRGIDIRQGEHSGERSSLLPSGNLATLLIGTGRSLRSLLQGTSINREAFGSLNGALCYAE